MDNKMGAFIRNIILLGFVMLILLMPEETKAETVETDGNFKYRVLSETTAEITGYVTETLEGDVVIPSKVGGVYDASASKLSSEHCCHKRSRSEERRVGKEG